MAKIYFFKISLLAAFIGFGFPTLADSCLVKLKVPKKYYECQRDEDCVIAGDACRSCATPLIVHRRFKKQLEEDDMDQRIKKNCLMMCEACSQEWVKPVCRKSQCTYIDKRQH